MASALLQPYYCSIYFSRVPRQRVGPSYPRRIGLQHIRWASSESFSVHTSSLAEPFSSLASSQCTPKVGPVLRGRWRPCSSIHRVLCVAYCLSRIQPYTVLTSSAETWNNPQRRTPWRLGGTAMSCQGTFHHLPGT